MPLDNLCLQKHLNIKPNIGNNVFVAPSANIIGKVNIGNDASIWYQTVIRGDVGKIEIGNNTNIQDGSILHVTHAGQYSKDGYNLAIGDNVTVGHNVTLHGCTIKNTCLIGMKSIVLDGAILEEKTMLAAGSLVPPNKHLEGGFLWLGNPIKKIRPLSEEELEFLEYSAQHYIKLKNSYLNN